VLVSGALLIGGLVLVFAGVIFWAVIIQPRGEKERAQLTPDDAWTRSGLDAFRAQGFALFQIVPTAAIATAEFVFQDETQRAIGRYIGNINKSATIEAAGKTMQLFIQGAPLGGTIYAGKVGGTSDDSIVIRNDEREIAEIWRENAIPPLHYRMEYSGQSFDVTTGGLSPLAAGTITRANQQIGVFRRVSLSSRNIFVAFRRDLADELKVCLCSIVLLE
jgi:hypothetical protein